MSLILTRRSGESIEMSFHGEMIKVRITSVDKRNGRVALSVDAPKEVVILREEVALRGTEEYENRGNR